MWVMKMKNDTSKKQSPSKRHHYLPRHYLEGFADSKNDFFVYDKKIDKIFSTSPDDAFLESNLNTIIFQKGDSSDFLETLYTRAENECWGAFNEIRNSSSAISIDSEDKKFLFLLFLYWRLPSNIGIVEALSEKTFQNDNEVDFFTLKSKSGGEAPKEQVEAIKNSPGFKKSLKVLLPFAPFFKDKDWGAELKNWRFLYAEKDSYIVGDRPILTRGPNDKDPLNCLNEFIFPISGKILLVNLAKPIASGLPGEFILRHNIAIIQQAQRFVACSDKSFLEAQIRLYKMYVTAGEKDTITTEVFDMLNNC
jgi:hypothetical protein